ncbi:9077_t:CDS:2 [Ambispora gerdemannii]|uniref:9077_t:CDS:1 n=1 Tax=Ambispora gerdemannii TaxID=144530 RepID=A0A9N8VBF8_9GLOM|nr:9077_t:CDS:2 [Ambispora gerdemannii]
MDFETDTTLNFLEGAGDLFGLTAPNAPRQATLSRGWYIAVDTDHTREYKSGHNFSRRSVFNVNVGNSSDLPGEGGFQGNISEIMETREMRDRANEWSDFDKQTQRAWQLQPPKNDEKIDQHDKKTEKYNSKGLLSDKFEEKNIGEVENDILEQIEKKSEKLKEGDLPRKWEEEKLPELKKIHEKIEELEKKENKSSAEETELKNKKAEYDKKFKEDKEDTIKNIQEQLEKNNLNITELDDNRSR